jgi:hypothetical protein
MPVSLDSPTMFGQARIEEVRKSGLPPLLRERGNPPFPTFSILLRSHSSEIKLLREAAAHFISSQ